MGRLLSTRPPGSRPDRLQRILLADEDLGVQATLAVTLNGKFLLADACTVAEALYLLTQGLPNILIVSAGQSDLDAGSLVRALRAKVRTCPVLLLADAAHVNVVRELMGLGINGYFVKPLRFDQLLERISALSESRDRPRVGIRRLGAHVSRAIQYLSCHHARLPTVKELASVVGISVGHLAHGFSVDTEMPPKEYLTRMRVELAKRLLARTTGSLDAIAEQVGFCDASHLSRVFRTRTGQAPGRFRRARAVEV
jgi:AraC-like DNA-binding protein